MGNLRIFRAGHAHAGVLLLMSLQTALSPALKVAGAIIVLAGILARSDGFFLHLALGQTSRASAGTAVTTVGAVLLATGVAVLVVGLITSRQARSI